MIHARFLFLLFVALSCFLFAFQFIKMCMCGGYGSVSNSVTVLVSGSLYCVDCKVVYPSEKVSVLPDKRRVMCGKLNGWQKVSAKHLVGFWMGWFIVSRGSSAPPVLHFNLVCLELLVHLQSFDKITMWLCESLPAQSLLPCPDQHSHIHQNRNLATSRITPHAQHNVPMPMLRSAQLRF